MKKAWLAFLTAFVIFGATVGVFLLFTQGIWIYYGDFNIQQIPFYIHLHDLVRSGNLSYDWATDLGGSVPGCYAFYILGSPFFWLTVPFNSAAVPYLIPWINALKYGVMAFTSYLWLSRHTKTEGAAFMGAMLYTFSGYSGAVLVFNHFHDVVAFFPLWLLCFDRLMQEKKRIPYILMTALMAIINYYFFVGGAVFMCIYFFTRYCTKREGVKLNAIKLMWRALWTSACGVFLSLWYLIPAIYYTLGNSRLKNVLLGNDLIAYEEPVMPFTILKNVTILSDISGLNSMLNAQYSRVSGIGAYLPMISVACVIAYFIIYKGSDITHDEAWPKRTLVVSLVFALIPGLNSMFSAFNSEYYARWYYMPVLIMALASVRVLEEIPENTETVKIPMFKGNIFVTACIAFFAVCAILPAKDSDENLTVLGSLKSPEQLIAELIFTALMTGVFFVLITAVFPRIKKLWPVVLFVTVACAFTCAVMMTEGEFLVDSERSNSFIDQCLKGRPEFPDENDWYRIETEQDVYNYPMVWNMPTNTAFISTVSPSIIDFYEGIGLTRKVTSKLGVSRIGTRTLLSSRYFIVEKETAIEHIGRVEETDDLSSFTLMGESDGFDIYENNYYVPMGFSFDYYVTEEQFKEGGGNDAAIDKGLMRFLILNEDDAEKYGRYMTSASEDNLRAVTLHMLSVECDKKREHACTNFKADKKGFTADAHMERDNLLFFSVPYDECFTAYVDGKETEIVRADFGFSAVFVPEGEHKVEFVYNPLKVYKNVLTKLVNP